MRYRSLILIMFMLSITLFADSITIHKEFGDISYTNLTKLELTSELILGTYDKDFKIKDISLNQVIFPDGFTYDNNFFTVNKNQILIQPKKAKLPLPFGNYLAIFELSTETGDNYTLILSFAFKKEMHLWLKIPPYSETDATAWLGFKAQILNCHILASSDFDLYVYYSASEADKPIEMQLARELGDPSAITLSMWPQKILSGKGADEVQKFEFYIAILGDYRKYHTGLYDLDLVFTLVGLPES